MSPGDWFGGGALLISAGALGMSFLRTARMQGSDRQRIKTLEEALSKLASVESVTAMGARVDDVEASVGTFSSALTKVAVIETKVDSLDRIVMRELDEIKHSLRTLMSRSFDPTPATSRRRRTPDG